MSDGDVTELLDRLVGPLDEETGDWDDVVERSQQVRIPDERRARRRRWPARPRGGLLLLGAAVAVAAVAALTLTSPWRGGPSILDRAAAAIAAPTVNQVLHERVVIRERVPCKLPNTPPTPSQLRHMRKCPIKGHGTVWLDSGPPQRFRVLFVDPAGLRDEKGGSLGAARALIYQPSDKVLDPWEFDFRVSRSDLDPVAFARTALASGRAQLDGTTTIRGREVLRIRVIAHAFGREVTEALYFADAQTYRPIRIVFTPGYKTDLRGVPLIGLPVGGTAGMNLPSPLNFDLVRYEYLPPTPENRNLANIRAQHPRAKIL